MADVTAPQQQTTEVIPTAAAGLVQAPTTDPKAPNLETSKDQPQLDAAGLSQPVTDIKPTGQQQQQPQQLPATTFLGQIKDQAQKTSDQEQPVKPPEFPFSSEPYTKAIRHDQNFSGQVQDKIFSDTLNGKILDYFGQGKDSNWGAPVVNQELQNFKSEKWFKDFSEQSEAQAKQINEGWNRASVSLLTTGYATLMASLNEVFKKFMPASEQPPETDSSAFLKGIKGEANVDATDETALIHHAIRGLGPAIGGYGGMVAGAEVFGAGGTALGAAIPLAGETGLPELILGSIGTVGGGIYGSIEGAQAVLAVEDRIISELPEPVQRLLGQTEEQRSVEEKEHPLASFIGELAPNLLVLRPGAVGEVPAGASKWVKLMHNPYFSRGAGAVLMGGGEAAQEYSEGQPLDPTKIGISAIAGTLMNRPTALGRGIEAGVGATLTDLRNIVRAKSIAEVSNTIMSGKLAQLATARANGAIGESDGTFMGNKVPTDIEEQNRLKAIKDIPPEDLNLHEIARKINPGLFSAIEEQETAHEQAKQNLEALQPPGFLTKDVPSVVQTKSPELLDAEKTFKESYLKLNGLKDELKYVYGQANRQILNTIEDAKERAAAKPVGSITPEQREQASQWYAKDKNISVEDARAKIDQNIDVPHPEIADQVTKTLKAAGVEHEQAKAAGALVQSHYESTAKRFHGKLGSGKDLFDRFFPEVQKILFKDYKTSLKDARAFFQKQLEASNDNTGESLLGDRAFTEALAYNGSLYRKYGKDWHKFATQDEVNKLHGLLMNSSLKKDLPEEEPTVEGMTLRLPKFENWLGAKANDNKGIFDEEGDIFGTLLQNWYHERQELNTWLDHAKDGEAPGIHKAVSELLKFMEDHGIGVYDFQDRFNEYSYLHNKVHEATELYNEINKDAVEGKTIREFAKPLSDEEEAELKANIDKLRETFPLFEVGDNFQERDIPRKDRKKLRATLNRIYELQGRRRYDYPVEESDKSFWEDMLDKFIDDGDKDDPSLFQVEHDRPNLYSQLERSLADIESNKSKIPKSAPADQWIGIINNLKGVKKEEIDTLGVEDWLKTDQKGKQVSKDDLIKFIQDHDINITTTELSGNDTKYSSLRTKPVNTTSIRYSETLIKLPEQEKLSGLSKKEEDQYVSWAISLGGQIDPKSVEEYEQYSKTYDRLFELRLKSFELYATPKELNFLKQYREETLFLFNQSRMSPDDTTFNEIEKTLKEIREKEEDLNSKIEKRQNIAKFTGSHFSDQGPNTLAHSRWDIRQGADGVPTFHSAEKQSDWMNKGRKYGFTSLKEELARVKEHEDVIDEQEALEKKSSEIGKNINSVIQSYSKRLDAVPKQENGRTNWEKRQEVTDQWHKEIDDLSTERNNIWKRQSELRHKEHELWKAGLGRPYSAVPDAPFKGTWQKLAVKVDLWRAVQMGAKRYSWDTGAVQIDRYNSALRKVVDLLKWEKTEEGIHLIGHKNQAEVLNTHKQENELSDAIGKAMADEIIKSPHQSGEFNGDAIKIEETWPKNLYDKAIPNFLNDYTKKWGMKVQHTENIHYIDFTDDFIKSVEQGQPKFQKQEKIVRGALLPRQNQKNLLSLFEHANASSLFHELGHQWLEELLQLAGHDQAPMDLVQDARTVRNWLNIEEGEGPNRPQHEQFARGFERYLMEGVSPSKALQAVFQKLKEWMTAIYQMVSKLKAPINDDIRQVFDRLHSFKNEDTVIAQGDRQQNAQAQTQNPLNIAQLKEGTETEPTSQTSQATSKPSPGGSRAASLEQADFIDKNKKINFSTVFSTDNGINKYIYEYADKNNGFFSTRGGGPLTTEEMITFANTIGEDPKQVKENLDTLRQRSIDDPVPHPVRVWALYELVRQAGENCFNIIKSDNPLGFAEAQIQLLTALQTFSASASEAGRTLHAFKMMSEGVKEFEDLDSYLQASIGKSLQQIQTEMGRVKTLKDVNKIVPYIKDTFRASLGEMGLEIFQNWLISGPITHMTYFAGNEFFALYKAFPETLMRAGIGYARELLTGDVVERTFAREAFVGLHSWFFGQYRGFLAAADSFRAGQTGLLPTERFATTPFTQTKMVPGVAGTVVRIPGERMVAPLHTWSRTLGYFTNLDQIITHQAMNEGLQGDALFRREAELRRNPPAELMLAATKEATEQSLMGRPGELTRLINRLTHWEIEPPGLGRTQPLRFLAPFVNVISNINRLAIIDRSILGLASKRIRDDLNGVNGKMAQDSAMSKMILGNAVVGTVGGLCMAGMMTGPPPEDWKEALISQQVNGIPYSFKIGEMSFQYSRLGVLGLQLSVASDMYFAGHLMAEGDMTKAGSLLFHSLANQFLQEGFLSDIADLFKAINESDKYGDSYINNMGTTLLVPFSIGMTQIARQVDPYMRQARTFTEAATARIPFMSETLEPRVDIFGNPIPNRQFWGVYTAQLSQDPVYKIFSDSGYYPSPVKRYIKGVPLDPKQYYDYASKAGFLLHQKLLLMIGQDWFDQLGPKQKFQIIKNAVTQSREQAETSVTMDPANHDIVTKILEKKKALVQ